MARKRALGSAVAIEMCERGRWTTGSLDALLRRLDASGVGPDRVVSLYLDTRWRDEQQRERVRLQVRALTRSILAQHRGDETLARDLEAAAAFTEAHAAQEADVGYNGAALFRAGARGLDLAVRCHAQFPTLLVAAAAPLTEPLVVVAQAHQPALVVLVDAASVRVHELGLGSLGDAIAFNGEVPRQHHRGGWSQQNYQRHREAQIEALYRAAAEHVTRRFDALGPPHVAVGGSSEATAGFVRALPQRVAASCVTVAGLHPGDPAREVLAAVERALSPPEPREGQLDAP